MPNGYLLYDGIFSFDESRKKREGHELLPGGRVKIRVVYYLVYGRLYYKNQCMVEC